MKQERKERAGADRPTPSQTYSSEAARLADAKRWPRTTGTTPQPAGKIGGGGSQQPLPNAGLTDDSRSGNVSEAARRASEAGRSPEWDDPFLPAFVRASLAREAH